MRSRQLRNIKKISQVSHKRRTGEHIVGYGGGAYGAQKIGYSRIIEHITRIDN